MTQHARGLAMIRTIRREYEPTGTSRQCHRQRTPEKGRHDMLNTSKVGNLAVFPACDPPQHSL